MAVFTSKAAGNWSAGGQTTWTQVGVPGSGDTVTVNHAITIDVDTIIGAGGAAGTVAVAMNAALTLAAGKTWTLKGDLVQADASFSAGAGCGLVFDTTGGNRKWLQGTAYNQTNCTIVIVGTSGSHSTISKTGSNAYWIDGGEEGSGAFGNCGGIELTYVGVTGLGKADGSLGIGSNDFGLHHRRLLHCTFDGCGPLFVAHPYQWGGGSNKDFRVEFCTFRNVPAAVTQSIYWRSNAAGAGTVSFLNNACENSIDFNVAAGNCDDNYFGNCGSFGNSTTFLRNFIREVTLGATVTGNLTDIYFLADHVDPSDRVLGLTGVGNPHFVNTYTANATYDGYILEYPHESHVDGGDGMYAQGSPALASATFRHCLALPSMTDDVSSGNLYAMVYWDANVTFEHNTAVGRVSQGTAVERDLTGHTVISAFKSNLIVGWGTGIGPAESSGVPLPNWGAAGIDLLLDTYANVDLITPSGIKNNDIYYPVPYTDTNTGQPHDGFKLHLSSAPDGTNRNYATGTPQFVDQARCAATWAVYKGYLAAGPARPALPVNHSNAAWITWLTWKRAALDAVHTALMGDPTLGHGDLRVWVKAGFAPQASSLDPSIAINAGHDGLTRGAVTYAGAGAPPPSPSGATVVCARQAAVYVP